MPYDDKTEHDVVTCVVFYPFLLSKTCVLLITIGSLSNDDNDFLFYKRLFILQANFANV